VNHTGKIVICDRDSFRFLSMLESRSSSNPPMSHVCLQTILLGDSGVGKTSLLVQFDTGRFQPGNFAATVGIGFTVSNTNTEMFNQAFQPDVQ